MTIRFDHINLTVHDVEQSLDWYKKVFGFEVVERGHKQDGQPWAIAALHDSMIAMSQSPKRSSADDNDDLRYHRIYHFGIRVDNEAGWQRKISRLGLKVYYGGPVSYPKSTSWYIQDPSGHEIEVSYSGGQPLEFPKANPAN